MRDSFIIKKNKEVFDGIYENGDWGGIDFSGEGSTVKNATPWIDSVNTFIKENNVMSILDLGCGDGTLIDYYDIDNINYVGVDVSERIINKNKNSKNKTFINDDIESYDYNFFDLIINKDVLQHLPNSSVIDIINKIEKSCKYALICNDYLQEESTDISVGEHHFINLNEKPFNKNYKIIKKYNVSYYEKAIYLFDSKDGER